MDAEHVFDFVLEVETFKMRKSRSDSLEQHMLTNKKIKTFHATMVVTRAEEWCVEASSAEEARALLAAGEGHRCHPGECIHAEVEHMIDEAA